MGMTERELDAAMGLLLLALLGLNLWAYYLIGRHLAFAGRGNRPLIFRSRGVQLAAGVIPPLVGLGIVVAGFALTDRGWSLLGLSVIGWLVASRLARKHAMGFEPGLLARPLGHHCTYIPSGRPPAARTQHLSTLLHSDMRRNRPHSRLFSENATKVPDEDARRAADGAIPHQRLPLLARAAFLQKAHRMATAARSGGAAGRFVCRVCPGHAAIARCPRRADPRVEA